MQFQLVERNCFQVTEFVKNVNSLSCPHSWKQSFAKILACWGRFNEVFM